MFMDVTQVSFDNILALTGNMTKITGRHTLKWGGEWRYTNYSNIGANTAAGGFLFTPGIYTGNQWANLLLGLPTNGNITTTKETGDRMHYGGLYLMDTFQLSRKLTLNGGLRWEQPGAFTEEHDLNTVFLPSATDPLGTTLGLPLHGLLALVDSSAYGPRQDQDLKWDLFSPRLGFAYRFTGTTVVKGGFGLSYLPSNSSAPQSPITSAVNAITPPQVFPAIAAGQFVLANPFPQGLLQPVGRAANYLQEQYGQAIAVQIPANKYPYATQWNFTLGQELGQGTSLEAGYVGSKGTHLPTNASTNGVGGMNLDQLPDQYDSMGAALTNMVPNPFFGHAGGTLSAPVVYAGQLLLPYPQYQSVMQNRDYWGSSIYHALQARLQKRLKQGSNLQVAYTWSKLISDVDSLYGFVEEATIGGSGGPQDIYNLKAERSISSFDVPQRLQISYNLVLPFGKGQKYLSGVHGVADALLSGWGLNGITTFQSGFPLAFQAQATVLSNDFGAGTPRPNMVAGCNQAVAGSAESRINEWFNTACFTEPNPYGFGNAPRVNSNLRAQGINNFDVSFAKKTAIRERTSLEFRAEFFNIFNRVQFAAPNTVLDSGLFGQVTAQANLPRIVQFALRLSF